MEVHTSAAKNLNKQTFSTYRNWDIYGQRITINTEDFQKWVSSIASSPKKKSPDKSRNNKGIWVDSSCSQCYCNKWQADQCRWEIMNFLPPKQIVQLPLQDIPAENSGTCLHQIQLPSWFLGGASYRGNWPLAPRNFETWHTWLYTFVKVINPLVISSVDEVTCKITSYCCREY